MKIKLNEDFICEVHQQHEGSILSENMVYCFQVACSNKSIYCDNCYLNGLSEDEELSIQYDKVKVED